jgi:predicted RNase H-like HicB family nuclease
VTNKKEFRNRGAPVKSYQEFDINYYQDEDGVFTAQVPAIRGCVASGRTLDEAYRNAVDAIESCLEARAKVAAMRLRKPRYAALNLYRRPVHA